MGIYMHVGGVTNPKNVRGVFTATTHPFVVNPLPVVLPSHVDSEPSDPTAITIPAWYAPPEGPYNTTLPIFGV